MGDADDSLADSSGAANRRGLVLPEKLLAKLWMARAGRRMRTTDGRRLRVDYPGRPAPGHGPDFRDALVELDGRRLRGPVELHRTPGGWDAHGHSTDPAYDEVVLHVVGRAGDGAGISGGPDLPTVALGAGVDGNEANTETGATASGRMPLAKLAALDEPALRQMLRRAGLARFRERTERSAGLLAARGVDQVLYAGIMDSLGYAENRQPFAELARRLPASVLRAAVMAFPPRRRAALLRDLLASASGLEAPSEAWLQLGGSAPMERSAWRLAGTRPSNHPLRRIDAAAQLLAWALPQGLAPALAGACLGGPAALTAVIQCPPGSGDDSPVVASPAGSKIAKAGGARAANGAAFSGRDTPDTATPYTRAPMAASARHTLGEQRAREIAVNAVLPVLLAWARSKRDRALARACVNAYQRFPALGENTVTREARRLLGERGPRLRLGACEHQGLIRLYRKAVGSA